MKIWLLILFLASGIHVFAQQFGGNPTTIHWKQINTDTARIIFPEELGDVAKRVASVVHDLQKKSHNKLLAVELRKSTLFYKTKQLFPMPMLVSGLSAASFIYLLRKIVLTLALCRGQII